MKKEILTLKSIYRFLVVKDYPIYTTGIIREKNRKGLTLVKFWQENLLYEFRNQKYGKIIWRNTGGRNRYLSDICNRSDRLLFYKEYVQEISLAATPQVILEQIQQFMEFLIEHMFSYEIFIKKLGAFLELLKKEDFCYQGDVADFFSKSREMEAEFSVRGEKGQAFFCGWYLTFLMLHAMAGECMVQNLMAHLREREELTPSMLWKLYICKSEEKKVKVHFMSTKSDELCSMLLLEKCFPKKEEIPTSLMELLKRDGKDFPCDINDMEKPEPVRQLLKYCCEENLVDDICVVQYEGNLTDSFIQTFLCAEEKEQKDKFREVLERVSVLEGHRVLFLIDNIDHITDEKAGKRKDDIVCIFRAEQPKRETG